MPLKLLPVPDIRIVKARCSSFESGYCYSAENPYYSGHCETADEALKAAERTKEARRTVAKAKLAE